MALKTVFGEDRPNVAVEAGRFRRRDAACAEDREETHAVADSE